jgi:hypothetical protein
VVVQAEAQEQQDWQTVAAVEVEASHLAALVRLVDQASLSFDGTPLKHRSRSRLD